MVFNLHDLIGHATLADLSLRTFIENSDFESKFKMEWPKTWHHCIARRRCTSVAKKRKRRKEEKKKRLQKLVFELTRLVRPSESQFPFSFYCCLKIMLSNVIITFHLNNQLTY